MPDSRAMGAGRPGETTGVSRRVIVGLVLAMALPALDLMALGAAGPEISGDLGRLDQIAWLFVSYQLALVVSVPVYGKLGDLHGRRLVFLGSVAIFTVASIIAGLAWSFPTLVAARVVQGIGGGGIISQTHAVIADLVPPRERGRYAWITPSVWTVAAFSGPVFGGLLAEYATWRLIFLVNVPFGLLAIMFVRDAFPSRSAAEQRAFDSLGAVLLVVSYGALIFSVSVGGDLLSWRHPITVVGLVGGGVVLAAFLVHELRTGDPVLPLSLLREPVVRACTATTFLIGTVNFWLVAFLPLMLQVATGVGATEAGLAILPVTASIAVTSTLVGRAVVRTGHYKIWPVIGSVLFAASFFWLARMGDDPGRAYLWTGTALQGAGMGFGTPVFMVAMQNAVAHRDVGVVSSLAMFARNTGQAFGTAFAGSLLVARLTHHLDRLLDPGALGALTVDDVRSDVDAVRSLDAPVEVLVQDAFRFAVTDLFHIAGWVGVVSAAVALTIPQIRLRDTIDEPAR